jgi:hypothetical protein
VGADDGVATFALPNQFHCDKAKDVKLEVEQTLAEHFGTRVPVELMVDDGAPPAAVPAAATEAPAEDEAHIDPDELRDAPPGLASPEDRLKEAFPGAEEVHS